MKYFNKHMSKYTIVFIGFIIVFATSNLKWGDNRYYSLLVHDGKGYYAYLPAVFIYEDLNFGFFDEIENGKYKHRSQFYEYRHVFEGKKVNKYYCGTAIVQTPFFLAAHYLSSSLGYDSDGYSKPYLLSISIASILYLLLGLIFLRRILLLYKINEVNISLSLLTIVFGTHLFYYAVVEPSMSHVFSFAFISWFIYIGKSYFIQPDRWKVLGLAALIGIIVLIRPLNILVIFLLPFLAGSFASLKDGFFYLVKKNTLLFVLGLFVASGILGIQFLIYYFQTGHFWVYSYSNEGFNFLNPHMIDILFSYKKGLFLYTPITFVALFGGYFLYKKNRFEFFNLFGFLILLTYFLSSWWNWWYGGSFSSRVYVEFLPIFAILLSFILNELNNTKWKRLFIVLLFAFVALNQLQTYQYRIGHLHYENMDKEKYWGLYPIESWMSKFNTEIDK